ncbi:hypothetical protein P8C59_008526 [Phyllachora maydis]|uniref:Uncharacterized protein n=1 Tax=Phyllachora maydis TaxID=1825666 RepID=A0AAD9MEP1_9PEZI|nr:hypothetical protein P8C59_008526 [Phyllachora maydis]
MSSTPARLDPLVSHSMSISSEGQWTLVLSLTALLLSLTVLGHAAARHAAAYAAAPREVQAFVDAVDSSIAENESYEGDVAAVPALDDKLRLSRLLRAIQREGDDLREDLGRLMARGPDDRPRAVLRTAARVLWASWRADLADRTRRLDLLRMRFLVVHLAIVTAAANRPPPPPQQQQQQQQTGARLGEKSPVQQRAGPASGRLSRSLTDSVTAQLPLRRLQTPAIGHQEHTASPHRMGWAGVVQELQKSPRMHKRQASIDAAMAASSP